jgi:uncharacterized protein (DUF1015 family)
VALLQPFSGLRYSRGRVPSLDDVVCPPYDVIDADERAQLASRSALNMVAVELPAGGTDRYRTARRLLDTWREAGILVRDRQRAFYGYRMSYHHHAGSRRTTVGVIGALGLEPPGGGIVPHEATTPKAVSDRLQLLRECQANVSPIWVLSPAQGLTAALPAPEHPAARAVDAEGVVHECWPVTDADAQQRIAALVGSAPVLVADGHHRYQVALAYQEERRKEGAGAGDHDAIMALVVELAEQQLAVQAIHRLVAGLPPEFDAIAALQSHYRLEATGPPDPSIATRMEEAGSVAVVTRDATFLATPLPKTKEASRQDLDTSRLDVALGSFPPHRLAYQAGWERAWHAVRTSDADLAVLVRPVTVAQIAEVGRGGERMPPKTTYFWPKPRTGMVVRELIG